MFQAYRPTSAKPQSIGFRTIQGRVKGAAGGGEMEGQLIGRIPTPVYTYRLGGFHHVSF